MPLRTLLKKIFVGTILVLFLLSPGVSADTVYALFFASFPDSYDLIAILVDKDLYRDTQNYTGLSDRFSRLSNTTMKARVDRYAEEIQLKLESARSLVIQVDKNDRTENIAAVLERLYFDGDPEEPDRVAKLKGIVIVGNVPLPVVNKKGNRFISMFPYTDFEDPAYIFNPATSDFELGSAISNPQVEVWHGVIRSPVADNNQLIAEYLDKNHLFNIGNEEFARFGKNIFFSDWFWEKKNISPFKFKNYLNAVAHTEDIAFSRYTKELLKALTEEFEQEVKNQGIAEEDMPAEIQPSAAEKRNAKRGIRSAMEEANPDDIADLPSADSEPPANLDDVTPDIQTKKSIQEYLAEYKDIFSKYPGMMNDLVSGTGRWDVASNLDSSINLITAKDKFTWMYLKAVSDMVEAEVDRIVNELQQNIPLVSKVSIEVKKAKIKVPDGAPDAAKNALKDPITPDSPLRIAQFHVSTHANRYAFSNHSPAGGYESGNYDARIWGRRMIDVTEVAQCSLYRGSFKAVEANRLYHPKSLNACPGNENDPNYDLCDDADFDEGDVIDQKPEEKGRALYTPFKEHAGCHSMYATHPELCFPEIAGKEGGSAPVFDYGGTKKLNSLPAGADDFRSCFNFHEDAPDNAPSNTARPYFDYLKRIDKELLMPLQDQEDMDIVTDPDRAGELGALKRAAGIVSANSPPRSLLHPSAYTLFRFTSDIPTLGNFSVTFADMLKALNFSTSGNVDWSDIGLKFFAKNTSEDNLSIPVDHPKVERIEVDVKRTIVKTIPSVFYHKEPTNEALSAQWKAEAADALPVDNPRYVTFQDIRGQLRKVLYPNVFKTFNLDEFKRQLAQKEAELNQIAISSGMQMDFSGRLTSLFMSGPDQTQGLNLKKASEQKILDAIDWHKSDLEQKHRIAFLTYLNSSKNAFIGERDAGYEMVYLNTTGDAVSADLDFQVQPFEQSQEEKNADRTQREREDRLREASGGRTGGFAPAEPKQWSGPCITGAEPYSLFDIDQGCSPWWNATKKWWDSLSDFVDQFKTGEDEDAFYENMKNKQKADEEALKQELKTQADEEYLAPSSHSSASRIAGVEIIAPFPFLIKGGASKIPLKVLIKNADAKILKDEAGRITANIEGDSIQFAELVSDEDPNRPGFQKTVVNGELSLEIVSTDNTGASKVKVAVEDSSLTDEISISVLQSGRLMVETNRLGVVANGREEVSFTVKAIDQSGAALTGIFGQASVKISDPALGNLADNVLNFRNGMASGLFTAGTKAGEATLTVSAGPFEPADLKIILLPGPAAFLSIVPEKDVLQFSQGSAMKIYGKILDANGNPVTTDNRTQLKFQVLEPRNTGSLSSENPISVRNGLAENTLSSGSKPGYIRIKLSDAGNRLPAAVSNIKSTYKITYQDIRESPMSALYVALLGFPAGNLSNENFMAGWALHSGKVQAVTSLTAPLKSGKRLLEVNHKGGVSISDDSTVEAVVVPGEQVKVEFKDSEFSEKVAEMIYAPSPDIELFSGVEAPNGDSASGIYLTLLSPDFSAKQADSGLSLVFKQSEKARVTDQGGVLVFDPNYSLKLKKAPCFALEILNKADLVAEIHFIQNFSRSVNISAAGPYMPGISLRPFDTFKRAHLENILTGNSTSSPLGVAFVSESEFLEDLSGPGFSANSLEDSLSKFGAGFTEQNKFALLFAGGSSVGEANMPYASDAGIVFGDPTVKIDNSIDGKFSTDVGRHVFSADSDIREVLNFDYNNDGAEDLFFVYDKGKVRLFENQGGKREFKDKGLLLNVGNGIAGVTKGDFNNDGQIDIVVAGDESCIRGETCVDIYENRNAVFTRKNLGIDVKGKIQSIQSADLNNDGKLDLVIADESGSIYAYYNIRGQFDLRGKLIGNMGLKIEPSKNLIQSLLINYDGLRNPDPSNVDDAGKFRELTWEAEASEKAVSVSPRGNVRTSQDIPTKSVKREFVFADLDEALRTSQKFGRDENGGVVETGDRITYTLRLKNSSANTLRNVKIADFIAGDFSFDRASLTCLNCDSSEHLTVTPLNDPNRPFMIAGFSIPAGRDKIIVYSGAYTASKQNQPKLIITIGNNLSDEYTVRDNFKDLAVTAEGNPTGSVRYFYSVGLDEGGRVRYQSMLSSPEPRSQIETPEQQKDNIRRKIDEALRDALTPKERPDSRAVSTHDKMLNDDIDSDGMPDSIDDLISADGEIGQRLGALADNVSDTISQMKCNAGCIPLPLNIAFLAPGNFNLMGYPGGYDPGLPVFGVPGSGLPPIWPPSPYYPSTFRIYVSPTLTGGVGTAFCAGPYGFGLCKVFAVPPSLLYGDKCDKLQGSIGGALARANSALADASAGMAFNLGGVSGGGGAANPRDSGGLLNYNLGSYDAPVSRSRNTRIPGFPSVISDWWASQVDEIVDKLADLPDIYFIYPTNILGSLIPAGSIRKIRSMADILTYINSIPLIDIETEDVTMQIPFVTRKEYERFKADAQQWVRDEVAEWDRIKGIWGCTKLLASGRTAEMCRLVDLRLQNVIEQVNQNIENVEAWLLLPKRILDYRNIEAYFARQIIAYLDQIATYTGGYLKKQKSRIALWEKQMRNIIETLKNWQALIDLMLDYQESCDKCTSERLTLQELLLKIFAAIPTPPVIPFPKWPDFVFDLSKIQAGVRIQWPQLDIKPVPFIFPKLPRIAFPLALPQFAITLPDIPVIPGPPELPQLPALPPIPLPQLPDIPPAPKIPDIPSEIRALIDILKRLTKLYCLIKTAMIPVPEYMLKPQIENMTARGLTPLLPIDLLATILQPSITVSYVDQLAVTAFTNYQPEVGYVLEKVKAAADTVNLFLTSLTDSVNKFIQETSQGVQQYTQPEIPGAAKSTIDEFSKTREIKIPYKPPVIPNEARSLENIQKQLSTVISALYERKKENEEFIKGFPKEVKVAAEASALSLRGAPTYVGATKQSSTQFESELMRAKQELMDYISNLNSGNFALQSGDLEAYSRIVANLKNPFDAGLRSRVLASLDLSPQNGKPQGKTKVGEWDLTAEASVISSESGRMTGRAEKSRFIAQAPGGAPSGSNSEDIQVRNVGLFAQNPVEVERVLAYIGEENAARKILYIDYDRDGDKDLLYTSGPDVFLKEFDKPVSNENLHHFSSRFIEFFEVSELLPKFTAVKPVKVAVEGSHDSTIVFGSVISSEAHAESRNPAGYSFVLKRSPSFHDRASGEESRIVDLIPKSQADTAPRTIQAGNKGQAISIIPVNLVLQDADSVYLKSGRTRMVIIDNSSIFTVKKGELIHPLKDSRIKFFAGAAEETVVPVTMFESIPVTDVFGKESKIEVSHGSVEILSSEVSENIKLRPGMMISENEVISIEDSAMLRYKNGASRRSASNTKFSWQILENENSPQAEISNLDPMNYYGTLSAFDASGASGTRSQNILLAPQVCGDKTAPNANVSGGESAFGADAAGKKLFRIPLLKTLIIDASSSADFNGNISKYTLDTNSAVDSNGDNDPANDANIDNGLNPKFAVGPFAQVETRQMRLAVYDEAMNPAYVDLIIEVIEPDIFLHEDKLREGEIVGHIEPRDSGVPIVIARNRNGSLTYIKTKSADASGRYITNSAGVFSVDDVDLRDRLVVKNSGGKVVAEINKKLGSIVITDTKYHLEAFATTLPNLPTRVAIVDDKGIILTFVFFVPDVNTDVAIDGPEIQYTKQSLERMHGVHIKPAGDLPAMFIFEVLAGDDPALPGAAVLKRNGEKIATIDVNGDIIFFDSRLSLKVKNRAFDEPVVFELYYENTKLAGIFIAVKLPDDKFVKVIKQSDIVPIPRPAPAAISTAAAPFTDVSAKNPLSPILKNLYDKGIIQGYTDARGQLSFRPEKAITRAEFTKITLEMLCISPREEAKKRPNVFSDILYKDPPDWFYDDTKEANLQGFIYGYLKDIDPFSGLAPFKPGNNITRAEAVKIIIEALEKLGAIALSPANLNGEPWFKPYIEIAKDLAPFIKNKAEVSQTFILAQEEAKDPMKKITRGEFAQMADRVLKIRDCFSFDDDEDGLPDTWEKKYVDDISKMNGSDDPDQDGLINKEEYGISINPFDPDTDKGGIKDGEEVKNRHTDPLNPSDDRPMISREQLEVEEGVFVVEPACASCPCLADVTEGADLISGDIIFAAIMKEDGKEIFMKSDEAEYK